MNNKDWNGNSKTTFVQLGASNHSDNVREINDYYATDPHTLDIFLSALERDRIYLHNNILECSCGEGHLSKLLVEKGYNVSNMDIIDRGYHHNFTKCNFLETNIRHNGDILSNPPYNKAKEFVEHSLDILEDGCNCIMLLKIQFLEGQGRRKLFDKHPPKYIYVNSARQTCYINGDMSKKMSSASCYCWFVWEKGYTGEPIIRWI